MGHAAAAGDDVVVARARRRSVTIHVALREALAQLSTDLIVATARIVVKDLKARFGLARPRLVVSGLNPHAGEDGSLGTEERSCRAAVEILRRDGIDARVRSRRIRCFIRRRAKPTTARSACITTRALIPIKTIAFEDAVNVTLGLPFIRLARSRHGIRYCRHRQGQSVELPIAAAASQRMVAADQG
jgi:4-hydroxythreonine-4-phosphate dehydrogenase